MVVSKGEEDEEKEEDNKTETENTEANNDLANFNLSFNVPEDKEETAVKVVNIVDGQRTVLYEEVYPSDKGFVFLDFSDLTVGSTIELYFDDVVKQTFTVNANTN